MFDKALLSSGACVDTKDGCGCTALIWVTQDVHSRALEVR